MENLFRAVLKNERTGDTQIILCESKDFGAVLRAARKAIGDGVDASLVDILSLNQIELWVSVFSDREMCPEGGGI